MRRLSKKKQLCGRCGSEIVERNRRQDGYTTLCVGCLVPHQLITRQVDPPGDSWRCDYCGAQGTMTTLQGTDCTHRYSRCQSCGSAPYCEPDCAAVTEVLSSPEVYVAGFVKE